MDKVVIWEDSDINDFCDTAMKHYKENETCYVIMIGEKRYITPAGKSVWREKNHATSAMNNHMAGYARKLAQERLCAVYGIVLKKEGHYNYYYEKDGSRVNMYKYPFYNDAYKNILKELKTRGILKVVELNSSNPLS